jgi:hypothetical protein
VFESATHLRLQEDEQKADKEVRIEEEEERRRRQGARKED